MLFEPCWSCTRTNLLSLYLFLQINDDDDDDEDISALAPKSTSDDTSAPVPKCHGSEVSRSEVSVHHQRI